MRNILGIDPSTRTGVAVVIGGETVHMDRIDTCKEEDILVRATRIVRKLKYLIEEYQIDLVVIEGYAMNGGFTIVQMVTIGAMIRSMLLEEGMEYLEVPPTTLKKITTGKGTAKKADMSAHVLRKFGVKAKNNDIADALALAMVGHHAYNLETISTHHMLVYKNDMLKGVA